MIEADLKIWHFAITLVGLILALIKHSSAQHNRIIRLEGTVIKLEERVKNQHEYQHENHSRLEGDMKDIKVILDKIWDKMEKKLDK
jgi:hypothetical protein